MLSAHGEGAQGDRQTGAQARAQVDTHHPRTPATKKACMTEIYIRNTICLRARMSGVIIGVVCTHYTAVLRDCSAEWRSLLFHVFCALWLPAENARCFWRELQRKVSAEEAGAGEEGPAEGARGRPLTMRPCCTCSSTKKLDKQNSNHHTVATTA